MNIYYKFCMEADSKQSLDDIFHKAYVFTQEQEEFEVLCGGSVWNGWDVYLTKLDNISSEKQLYHFEVRKHEVNK